MQTESALKEQIIKLAPWHLNVQVTENLTTAYTKEVPADLLPKGGGNVSFIDPRASFMETMKTIYPNGLEGKRFLDCACNCGGYSFWAKELGATETFGFDVREHWINQARFLKETRKWPSDNMRFEVRDLYDIPSLNLGPFDITLFKGIFYHLPDPITGLKHIADLTREILILDTATLTISDPEPFNGVLVAHFEGVESYMSGVHKLSWFPSGPKVLRHILSWLGFCQIKVVNENKPAVLSEDNLNFKERYGRISLIASKIGGLLDNIIHVKERATASAAPELKGSSAAPLTELKESSAAPHTDPAAEIWRLQRENEYLRSDRQILKKAISILSENQQSGM